MRTIRFWPTAAFVLACLGSLALARAPVGDPPEKLAEKLAELRETRDTAMTEWENALRAAKDQTEGMKIWQARPGKDFLPAFKEIAIEAKGTDTARMAWFDVLEIAGGFGEKSDAILAVDTTVADHIDSPDLGEFAALVGEMSYVIGQDTAVKALETLVEKSKHRSVQASALFGLGNLLYEDTSPDKAKAGRKALERLVADYADVNPKRGPGYAERAKGILFELDNLQIGMVAPNFESIDENGQKFSIADYKGKVVVLDFWGNW